MSTVIDVAGWTLVSFIWQGALLGIAAAVALISIARLHPIDGASRPAFLAAADGIHSDHEQGRVFAALVRAERRN